MHSEHEALVRATVPCMFDIVADVERWPERLAHYSWVRTVSEHGNYRLVRMAAVHHAIPLSWICEVETFPEEPAIRFHHVGGITDEMVAVWQFDKAPDGVLVRVIHDMHLSWPFIGSFVDKRIIGPLFVDPISAKTLHGLKLAAQEASK